MTEDDWIDLYHRHMPPLYRAISRRVGADRGLAEDLTHEAWLRALDHWHLKGLPKDPAAWLIQVAKNLLRNHFRRRRPESLEAVPPSTDPSRSTSTETPSADAAQLLQWGLARLRPAQAELLSQRHFDGASLAELATRHGLSERAVEGRLRRAREHLARFLGDRNPLTTTLTERTHDEPARPSRT